MPDIDVIPIFAMHKKYSHVEYRQEKSKDENNRIGMTDIIECAKCIIGVILAIVFSLILLLIAFIFGHAIQKASEIPENLYEQHKKSGQYIETESEDEKERYFRHIYFCASGEIKNKTLSKDDVRCYIRHLPIKGDTSYDEWGEEVLNISNKCLHELYEYSKEMHFIDDDCSFTSFCHREF